MNASMRIASGSTVQGATAWQQYDPTNALMRGVFVDVDTSQGGFTKTPNYVISLCGHNRVWEVSGASAVYDPTPIGFRVYLRWSYNKGGAEAPPLTPAMANQFLWFISWIGIQA
jgi:hypothetical protein